MYEEKRKRLGLVVITLIVIFLSVAIIGGFSCFSRSVVTNTNHKDNQVKQSNGTTYDCDVRVLSFNTKIVISKNNEEIGVVSGNVLKFITDPLVMKKDEIVIAQASDDYNVINQDDHAIIVNGEYQFTMSGGFKVLGEKYTLKDFNNNEIAHADFNVFNTEGTLVDNNGNLIAKYESNYFLRDYTVTVYDTNLNHDALLLVFASYYSDFAADNSKSNK